MPFGLVDSDGKPKPEYHAMLEVLRPMPEFILGFRALADLIPDVVGEPIENERHNPDNGDGLQQTTTGLMVWRKADNWTAFTDGYRTWVNGPQGLQVRLNSERFDWERPARPYKPTVLYAPTPSEHYPFLPVPRGVLLHGSRSGVERSVRAEFEATVSYAAAGAAGLAWNYTVGDDAVAVHLSPRRYGWNARKASMRYVALELAQATANGEITEGQVRGAAWCIAEAQRAWPTMPLHLPTHAEVEALGETGHRDGKTDVFPAGDPRAEELRGRILARL